MGLTGLLLFGSAAGTVVAGGATAGASTSDGTLTVQVLRDFFGTGVINTTMDTPQQGMTVEVTDVTGARVRASTDATGKVVVPPSTELVGGQYRVDVSIPAPYSDYLRAAPASTKPDHFDSFTSFVDLRDGTDQTVVTAVWNPADHTLPDTRYYVPVQTPAVQRDGTPSDPAGRALVAFGQGSRGTCPDQVACPTVINTQSQVGTTWGLAYDKDRERVFQAAFAKRFTEYGPGGGGAIYATPVDGSAAPELFATVPGATATEHGAVDMRKDPAFVDVPGKESLGGLTVSEDGATLYAVNLLTRELVSFDATAAKAPGVATSVPIPDPGCASPDDWRPFALTAHDAKLYVGGVCSAESTQDRADLKVVVSAYDGSTFTEVLTHGLTYPRGYVIPSRTQPETRQWNPWDADLATWDERDRNGVFIDPQPELATMAFTRDGSLILGFRDRFADVLGAGGLDPRPGRNTPQSSMSGGDITMACAKPTGGFDWEGTGECPNHGTTATNGRQLDGVVEYFHGDFFDPNRSGNGTHQETAQGSVAYIPQQQWVVSTELDPARDVNSNGAGFYDVNTGVGPGHENPTHGYQFIGPRDNGFAKAGGLGDIAYQTANAPIQIGNVVWFDGDHNGVQDPYHDDEVPLEGATIHLLDADGKKIATTRTDAAGEYYFGGVGASPELTRGAQYTVQFDVCTALTDNVPDTPPAKDLRFTLPTAGDDRVRDSNVTPPTTDRLCNGYAPVTAPTEAGGVDHTIDAGVHIPKPVPPTTPPPTTEAPPTTEPTPQNQAAPAPAPTTPPTPKPAAAPLAHTGIPALPELLFFSLLAITTGAALWRTTHKRPTN
ncbi:SdrD B-like domain-containing protein [Actinokineospora sp. G85]|uniref:SdrD B-like domain-containing protein n=1 Tax=Actinokineospora sp. G85 TaxID=3406626 RepID=UPI003C771074